MPQTYQPDPPVVQVRLLPPPSGPFQTITLPSGRVITGTAGVPIDIGEADGGRLEGNGWIRVAWSGPTSNRPPLLNAQSGYRASKGTQYFDTTINALIEWDGATWRDATGSAV